MEIERKLEFAHILERLKQNKGGVLRSTLFKAQLEFLRMPVKKKLARCSRRAGKTNLAAKMMLIEGYRNPGSQILYITLTLKNAKRIIWQTFRELSNEHDLKLDFKIGEMQIEMPNGTTFVLGGASDKDEVEKYRGSKYPLVVLDEVQSMRRDVVEYAINEVIEPATLDLNGSIVMLGTPNAASAGYFYDCDQGIKSNWGRSHWTLLDNPYIPHAKAWLLSKMEENSWDEGTALYRREYLGEWARDESSLVYKFSMERHIINDPPEDLIYVLGVDLGFDDATAFTTVAFSEDKNEVYVIESYKMTKLVSDDIASEIKKLENKYSFIRKVVDTGGLGKMIVEEMNRRFSLGLTPAEKGSKLDHIELLNSDFQNNRIKINKSRCQPLIDELLILEWDAEHLERGRFIEQEDRENHCSDSFLYSWRECRHYLRKDKIEIPEKGTEAWFLKQEDDMELEADNEIYNNDKDRDWWE